MRNFTHAIHHAHKSPCHNQHGAVLAIGGSVQGVGWNSFDAAISEEFGSTCHAEQGCVKRFLTTLRGVVPPYGQKSCFEERQDLRSQTNACGWQDSDRIFQAMPALCTLSA